jgi:transposase
MPKRIIDSFTKGRIFEMLRTGVDIEDIYENLSEGVSISTLYRLMRSFKITGKITKNVKPTGRPKKVRNCYE